MGVERQLGTTTTGTKALGKRCKALVAVSQFTCCGVDGECWTRNPSGDQQILMGSQAVSGCRETIGHHNHRHKSIDQAMQSSWRCESILADVDAEQVTRCEDAGCKGV